MPQGSKLMAGLVALRALPNSDAIFSFSESLLASTEGVESVSIEKGGASAGLSTLLDSTDDSRSITIPIAYKRETFATIHLTLNTDDSIPLLTAISNFANLVALELSHSEKKAELTRLLQEQSQENSRLIATTLFAAKASGIGVWEYELESQDLVWNEQMFDIFGLQPDKVQSSFEDWVNSLHPEDAEAAQAELQECIDHNKPFESQFRIVRPNGQIRYIAARAEFFTDTNSGKRFLIGTNIDVTETKNLELQLRHAQRLEAIGQLTGGIAHDFNNLLQVISGSVQLLQVELDRATQSNPKLERYADTAMAAIDSASSLTSRLLAFSRRDTLNPASTSLSALLDDALVILKRTLGDDIDLELDIPSVLPPLYIDKHQLENALLNLAINARDAMANGGRLEITAKHTSGEHLLIGGEKIDGNDYVAIAVKDSGIGMTPEVLEQAFDPFFTTKEVGKGSGLGLSMVHGFVNQSGGHITMHSKPGVGTLVRLYLPVATEEPVNELEASESAGQSGQYRVLLVEDDSAVQEVAQAMLESESHLVTAVTTGADAISLLQADHGRYDILFTDMALPGGMNGLQLADHVAQQWPDIRILFSSGYVDRFAEHAQGLVVGKNFLKKPYKKSSLLGLIEFAMSSEFAKARPNNVFNSGEKKSY